MSKIILIIMLFVSFSIYSQNDQTMANFGLFDSTFINFEFSSKKDFDTHKNSSCEYNLKDDIKKENGSYVLNFENKTIILRDKFEEDDPAFTEYTYMYSVTDFLYFKVRYYEITTSLVINQVSGNITEFLGEINFSPDCKFIFVASKIIDYEPFPNTIEIYKVVNNQIILVAKYNIGDWIPDSIKWINEKTVIFKQRFKDNRINYIKMTISVI